MDYTTYPDGFEAMIRDLKMPFDDFEQKKNFFIGFMDSIIKQ